MLRVQVLSVIVALLAVPLPAAAGDDGLSIHENLPRDPLLLLAISEEELSSQLEAAKAWLARAQSHPAETSALAAFEARIGLSLGRDLLTRIGPEIALAVDLPPLDGVAVALRISDVDGYQQLLSRTGLLAGVRDEKKLAEDLRRIFEVVSGVPPEGEDVMSSRVSLSAFTADPNEPASGPSVTFHYAIKNGRLALGFSPDWVRAAIGDRAETARVGSGEDYRKVFSHLDGQPQSLTYVNLPKLRQLVGESQIVAALLESNPGVRQFLGPLLDSEIMSVGLGSTSVVVSGGVRTTHFGPPWMSGTAASSGLLATLAVPTLLVAADRNKSRETLADMQSIAVACAGFSTDVRSYPGPTEGWVPVESVAAFLEPIYIASLPRTDAWDNPILYWSNGASYRILSMGPDGQIDQDWSGVTEPTTSAQQVGDIVVADGRILVLPRQLSGALLD